LFFFLLLFLSISLNTRRLRDNRYITIFTKMAERCSECCKVNCEFDTGDTGSVCPIGQYQRSLALQKQVQDIEEAEAHAIAVNVLAHEKARARKLQHDKFCAEEERKQTARIMANMSGSNDVVCPICQSIRLGLPGLYAHMRVHYEPFTCQICSVRIPNFAEVTKHQTNICSGVSVDAAYFHFREQKTLLESQIA
jgi:hypothetical protein